MPERLPLCREDVGMSMMTRRTLRRVRDCGLGRTSTSLESVPGLLDTWLDYLDHCAHRRFGKRETGSSIAESLKNT